MSYLAPKVVQSTSTEITALTNLTDLASSGSGQFVRKTGATTFENSSAGTGNGDLLAANNLSDVSNTTTAFTNIKQAASETATGVVEFATSAEINTATSTTLAMSPSRFAYSNFGKKFVGILVVEPGTNTATGDGKAFFRIPEILNGWNLISVAMSVYTAGTTNTTDVQIRNITQGVDMLSTKLTIDSTEVDSSTAATPAVINLANDNVSTGDRIAIDVDAIHTTAAKGLFVEMLFQIP